MSTEKLLLFAGELHAQWLKVWGSYGGLFFEDYHGFGKCRLPLDRFKWLLDSHQLNPAQCQVEVIRVNSDLSDELHHHNHSDAAIIVLGQNSGFIDPSRAFAHLNGEWHEVRLGAIALIPAGTTHGFKVKDGGILYFLSVQIPPIVGNHGDDYVKDV